MTFLTKDEASLLLYLETCAVDYGGKVDLRHMNPLDLMALANWTNAGFVDSGRIRFKDIHFHRSYWVVLSDEAWEMAHKLRRERCERLYSRRAWRKAGEEDNGVSEAQQESGEGSD
jgi:hypothetical protein